MVNDYPDQFGPAATAMMEESVEQEFIPPMQGLGPFQRVVQNCNGATVIVTVGGSN